VVEKFFGFYKKTQEKLTESEEAAIGKQCSNLVIILSHLYNFQVISSQILTDFLKIFVESFSELDVELLLLVLKCTNSFFQKQANSKQHPETPSLPQIAVFRCGLKTPPP